MNVLWPMFALFALTAVVVFRLAALRTAAVRERRVDPRFYRLFRGYEEPEDIAVVARNLHNLFEAPVLFYAATLTAYAAGLDGAPLVILGWAYVALRGTHTWVHLHGNPVMTRFRLFAASWGVLILYWAALAVALALEPGWARPA